jgi:protoheme IX farnesyltransferase
LIGAFPGALPPLIGCAAAQGHLDAKAWALFAIVFLWQFPHFMAIAWMYRDDYDRAGYLVLPGGEARTPLVNLQTLLPLVALTPLSILPGRAEELSLVYCIGAALLGLGFLYYGVKFVFFRSNSAARRLLMASIIYLPFLFVWIVVFKG